MISSFPMPGLLPVLLVFVCGVLAGITAMVLVVAKLNRRGHDASRRATLALAPPEDPRWGARPLERQLVGTACPTCLGKIIAVTDVSVCSDCGVATHKKCGLSHAALHPHPLPFRTMA